MPTSPRTRGGQRLTALLAAAMVLSMAGLAVGGAVAPVQGIGVAMLEAISASEARFGHHSPSFDARSATSGAACKGPTGTRQRESLFIVERLAMPGRGNLPPPRC
jgi:hypothetical protein